MATVGDVLQLLAGTIGGDEGASSALADVCEEHGQAALAKKVRAGEVWVGAAGLRRADDGPTLHLRGVRRRRAVGQVLGREVVFYDARDAGWAARLRYDAGGRLEVVVNRGWLLDIDEEGFVFMHRSEGG